MHVEAIEGISSNVVEGGVPQRPAAILEMFVQCIESGEVQAAIAFLSGRVIDHIGHAKLESMLSSSSSEISSFGGIESVETRTLAFSRDRVEMQLTIWYGDHREENEVVELVREEGGWKISLEEANMIAVDRL